MFLVPVISKLYFCALHTTRRPKRIKVTVSVSRSRNSFAVGQEYDEQQEVEVRNRNSLLQFQEDHRPPYFGTWSKTSGVISGRRPLSKDTASLNYDVDSEEEWEEEEEPGESLSGSEHDDEVDGGDDDGLDYDDGWLRQDDDLGLSDQEEGPHNERHLADPQHPHSTGGGQTRILGPIFLDLDPDKEQEWPHTPLLEYRAVILGGNAGNAPVLAASTVFETDACEAEQPAAPTTTGTAKPKKPAVSRGLPVSDDNLASFVKLLHGSSARKDKIAEDFMATVQPSTSRFQVLKRIKEVASFDMAARRWSVKDEVLTSVGYEAPAPSPSPAPVAVAPVAAATTLRRWFS